MPRVVRYGEIVGYAARERKNYAVILGRFFLDPIWWMFVTWLPIYLIEVFNLDIKQIAMSAWVPYVGAAIGSVAGGWFSGLLINRGKTVNFARKAAMIVGSCFIIPGMILAAVASSASMAVIMMAFILGGYQFVMTNIQTLPATSRPVRPSVRWPDWAALRPCWAPSSRSCAFPT